MNLTDFRVYKLAPNAGPVRVGPHIIVEHRGSRRKAIVSADLAKQIEEAVPPISQEPLVGPPPPLGSVWIASGNREYRYRVGSHALDEHGEISIGLQVSKIIPGDVPNWSPYGPNQTIEDFYTVFICETPIGNFDSLCHYIREPR